MAEENKKAVGIGQLDEASKERLIKLSKRLADVQSVEELIAVCKEEGLEVSEDKAGELYAKIEEHRAAGESGELTDEELENVNGGILFSVATWLLNLAGVASIPGLLVLGAMGEADL